RMLALPDQNDDAVRVVDVASGTSRVLSTLGAHPIEEQGLAFLRDGRLVSATEDAQLRIWNVDTRQSRILQGHERKVRALAVAPDGLRFASADVGGDVRWWDREAR